MSNADNWNTLVVQQNVAVAQCKGWAKSKGRRCMNKPRVGQLFCHLHSDQENETLTIDKTGQFGRVSIYVPHLTRISAASQTVTIQQCNGWAHSKGRRCMNRIRSGQAFCYLHVNQASLSLKSVDAAVIMSTAGQFCNSWLILSGD
jgi:hypothetical protein